MFEERIGCFNDPPPKQAQDFIENLVGFFKYMQPLMYNVPVYKIWPTKTWKIYEGYADRVLQIGQTFVDKVYAVYCPLYGHCLASSSVALDGSHIISIGYYYISRMDIIILWFL